MIIGGIIVGTAAAVVLATSLFKNVNWSAQLKNSIAILLSVIAAVVTIAGQHHWNFSTFATANLLDTVTLIYGTSQLIYHYIVNGIPIIDKYVNKPLENVGSKKTDVTPVAVDSAVVPVEVSSVEGANA